MEDFYKENERDLKDNYYLRSKYSEFTLTELFLEAGLKQAENMKMLSQLNASLPVMLPAKTEIFYFMNRAYEIGIEQGLTQAKKIKEE